MKEKVMFDYHKEVYETLNKDLYEYFPIVFLIESGFWII